MSKKYKINEIFASIQGEGEYVGTAVVFIRFSGCNLNCDFCDTIHKPYKEMTAVQILEECNQVGENIPHIVLTGGEPALQLDEDLINLLSKEFYLHLETNGTKCMKTKVLENLLHICISPKEYEDVPNLLIQLRQIGYPQERVSLKFLYESNNQKIHEYLKTFKNTKYCQLTNLYIQPIDDINRKKNLVDAIKFVKENTKYQLSVQLHKLLNIK